MKRFGLLILLLGLFFNIAETAYFGWNHVAQSQAEEIADQYSFMLGFLGCVMLFFGHVKKSLRGMSQYEKKGENQ